MEAGKKRSQDDFRRLLHKQAETPLYAAAEADSAAAEDELDEDEIEDNLWGEELPDAKEITAEQARRNAIANTSSKGGALNRPLPPGWVERTSKKKAAGKVYYVNLKTKKYQRDRPVPPELDELLQPKAKKMKVKPKVTQPLVLTLALSRNLTHQYHWMSLSIGAIDRTIHGPKVSSVEDALTRLEIAMKKVRYPCALRVCARVQFSEMSTREPECAFRCAPRRRSLARPWACSSG